MDNLDIEEAVYRDFKQYFENPGEGLTEIANIKNLFGKFTNEELIGTFVGVTYTESAMRNQSSQVSASGFHRTTVVVKCKTYAPDDPDSAQIRASAKAVRELMNREGLATTFNILSEDQTYYSFETGPSQSGSEGKFRTHEFSYTVIHKVSN